MTSKMWLLIEFFEELLKFDVVNYSELVRNYVNVKPGDKVSVRTQDISRSAKIVRISEDKSSLLKQKEVLDRHAKTLHDIMKICKEATLEEKDRNLSEPVNSQVREVRISPSPTPPRATHNLDIISILERFRIDAPNMFETNQGLRNNLTGFDISFNDRHDNMANKVVLPPPDNIMGISSFSSSSTEDQDSLRYHQPSRSQIAPPQPHNIMAIRARSSSTESEANNRIWEGNRETTQGFDLFPPIYNRRESNLDRIQEIRGDPLHRSTPLPTNDASVQQNKNLCTNHGTQTSKDLCRPSLQEICDTESALHSLHSYLQEVSAVAEHNYLKYNSKLIEISSENCHDTDCEFYSGTATSIVNQAGPSRTVEENPVAQIQNISKRSKANANFQPSQIVEENPVAQIQNISTRTTADVLGNFDQIRDSKSPVQLAESSRIVDENPVAQIQDTSTRNTADVIRNSGQIRDSKRPAQQAEPSRIEEENSVAQIQDTSTRTTADDLRNPDQIRNSKRPAQLAGSSLIVNADLMAQIQDTLKNLTVAVLKENGIIPDFKRPVKKTGSSRIAKENSMTQIQDTSTITTESDNDLRNNGLITKLPAQQAGPSRIAEENPIPQIQDTSTITTKSDSALRNNGPIPKSPAQQAEPSRIVKKKTVTAISNTSTMTTANVPTKPAQTRNIGDLQTQDTDLVPIGDGNAKVSKRILNNIDWTSYSGATRRLLQEVFPRSVLATHSLTGKKSPAFMNREAKKILNPKLVEDIVKIVSTRCNVPRNLVRNRITIKCTDEAKLYRNRQLRNQKRKKPQNDENRPPSSPSSE